MPSPGRPIELKNPTHTTISVEHNEFQKFKALANDQGKPVSKLIREWIRTYIETSEQGKLDPLLENSGHVYLPTLGDIPKREKLDILTETEVEQILRHAFLWYKEAEAVLRKRNVQEDKIRRVERGEENGK